MTRSLLPALLVATVSVASAQGPRRDTAPALGAAIPDVSAKSPDGKTTVALNEPKRLTVLLDDMNDSVARAFSGHPDRLFILSPSGTIAYRGGKGPRGFDVEEMQTALEKLLAPAEGTE